MKPSEYYIPTVKPQYDEVKWDKKIDAALLLFGPAVAGEYHWKKLEAKKNDR